MQTESIIAPDSIPELSEDVQLEYLAEGGANIVYRIFLPPAACANETALQPSEIEYYGNTTPPPTEIEEHDLVTDDVDANVGADVDMDINITSGKLLRLRKDVPFGLPYAETVKDFHSKIQPLFKPEELVDQSLVRVPRSLIQRCNEKLQDSERTEENHNQRPFPRHGVYLATDEPLGMLITDMTNTNTPTNHPATPPMTVAELKPKWLVQSPSAPKAARRCRTCALRDMKAADAAGVLLSNIHHIQSSPGKASFCPLDLISDNEQDIQRTVANIFARHRPFPNQIRTIARRLYRHPTLLKLHSLQRLHNKVGLHGPPPGSKEMSISMTLRDCSIFLKLPPSDTETETEVDLRLGDLDLKSAGNGKAEYWLSIENRLINERWYMGRQASQGRTEGECVLSR